MESGQTSNEIKLLAAAIHVAATIPQPDPVIRMTEMAIEFELHEIDGETVCNQKTTLLRRK